MAAIPAPTGSASLKVTHSKGAVLASTFGVMAEVGADSSADLTVEITGGSASSVSVNGRSPAVVARQWGTGSVMIDVSDGVALTSRRNAGVRARLYHADNAAGRIAITQGGTISGRTGVRAEVWRYSAMDETRAASAQPLIDITWTGTFAHGTGVATDDTGRLWATDHPNGAVPTALVADASAAARFGQAAGIEAGALSWREVAREVAKGDDPGAFADMAAVTALFDDGADAATKAQAAAIVARFRAAVTHEELATISGVAAIDDDGTTGLSDEEIEAYLSDDTDQARALLRSVLAGSLSETETAVLKAVVTGGDVDGALAAGGAGFSDAYKMAVKDLLNRFNVGDIRVNVNGGSITSRGDGVRAWYATPNDKNGRIDITVAEGATVAGGMAGVWVANAGMGEIAAGTKWGGTEWGDRLYLARGTTVTLRRQFVTVNGTVRGGTDAAVHLMGGGALLVGGKGKVHAGPGQAAVLVNDPGRSEIVIHGEVRGAAGAPAAIDVTGGGTITVGLTGRVTANGATRAIQARKATSDDMRRTAVRLHVAASSVTVKGGVSQEKADAAVARVQGGIADGIANNNRATFVVIGDDGFPTSDEVHVVLTKEGDPNTTDLQEETPDDSSGRKLTQDPPGDGGELDDKKMDDMKAPPPEPVFNCDTAEMVDDRCRLYEALPSALLAMNGLPTREERLAAARNEAGAWARVETSRGEWTADSSTRAGVAYDRERSGVRVGVDGAVGENVRLGVSAHGLRGSADMTQNGGKVELSGVGVSVSGAAAVGDGVYIDAQAGATRYDVKLTSKTGRILKDGATGTGYALAVEAGRPVAVGDGVTLTPRAGFVWSRVSLSDFGDSRSTAVCR